jgi:hypothetical protein
MSKRKYLLMAVISIFAVSCAPTKPLYNWRGYDDAVYAYTKSSDEKSNENLVNVYEKLIKKSGGSRQVPPPGVCADYGYVLIKKGEIVKGKALLVKETILYPESKQFIDRIIKRFDK